MSDNKETVELMHGDVTMARGIVEALLGGDTALLEDRVDNMIAKYNTDPKNPRFKRLEVMQWAQYDPTRNKKYLPWIIKEVAEGRMELPKDGHELSEALMAFERLLPIPTYTGTHDLYSMDWEGLKSLVGEHGHIRSKTSIERAKREAGVTVVAKAGDLECLRITDAQALSNWSWKAYSENNPNWDGKPVHPGDVKDPFEDSLWCTRFLNYGNNYLDGGPFHMVLKNGWPYVGLVFHKGEAQDLHNHGITAKVAEEVWPVVKDCIPADVTLSRNAQVFSSIRFLEGAIPPGSKVQGPVDLSGTRLSALPSNLTVTGTLNVSNTPLTKLPPGLTVTGTLQIYGTQISELPNDLKVDDMEWSEPLDWSKVKTLFYHSLYGSMKEHLFSDARLAGLSDAEKEKEWVNFQPQLLKFFQTNPSVDKNARSAYRYVGSTTHEK